MQEYFEMQMGDSDGEWCLAILDIYPNGSPVDIWAYNRCQPICEPRPVPFKIQLDGRRVDFNPTAFGAMVVSRRMADRFEQISPCEIQRIPANVEGESGEWEVINVLSCLDCIDEKASRIQYFPTNHPKSGKPRSIFPLVLDSSRIGRHHVFHLKDWRVATIVSNVVKNAFDEIGATGIKYMPVTGIDYLNL